MTRVLAIDPGVTTGFALAIVDPDEPVWIDYRQVRMSPYQFGEYIKTVRADFFVCESFQHRSGQFHKDVLFPVELIGVLKYMEGLFQLIDVGLPQVKVFFQPPATQANSTAFYTDQKIKDLGLWIPGKQHGRSALKHLLHWFKFGFGATMPHGNFQLEHLDW